ncbi:MAG: hypothetical protein U0325_01450 [Polyangiales bacterium]
MRPAPRWSRALLLDAFSERRVAVGANVALLTVLALRAVREPLGDPDAWWIAAAGRELLATRRVPAANAWSSAHPHDPWVFHEWLLSPLYAIAARHGGSALLALLGVLAGLGTAAALLVTHRRAGVRDDTAAWTVFVALLALQSSAVSPRPGYALLALPLLTLALTRAARFTPAVIAALVALTAVWSNAHGSFPLAVLLVGASVLSAPAAERWRRAGTLALCALTTLLNPFGADLHRLVLRYLVGGDPMAAVLRAEVLEFQPVWRWPAPFANPWVVAVNLGVAALAAHALRVRARRVDATLALLLGALGVMQARHLALAAVVGLALLAPHLEGLRVERPRWSLPAIPALFAVPALLAALLAAGTPRDHVAHGVGGAALPALAQDLRAPRAWVPFDATGWFLWSARARSDARLLFDARNDCHRAEVARDALALERAQGDLCRVVAARSLDVVLAPADHPTLRGVLRCPGWRVTGAAGGWVRAAR